MKTDEATNKITIIGKEAVTNGNLILTQPSLKSQGRRLLYHSRHQRRFLFEEDSADRSAALAAASASTMAFALK